MIKKLPKTNDKIKLKSRDYTLSDVVDALIELDDRLIRKISQDKLNNLTNQSEFDLEPPFVIIKVFKTYEDHKNDSPIHMVFANHGQVPYLNGEVLESYRLNEPRFFWDFKLQSNTPLPHPYRFSEMYSFSEDTDAISNWEASLHYDEIFEHFCLDGGEDLAGFAGFFWVEN